MLRNTIAVLIICVAGFAAPIHAKGDIAGAEAFIHKLADEAISKLTDKSLSPDEQETRFREILREYVAFESIARWVLGGRYWKSASDVQQQRYLALFEDLMVATYAHRFQNYSGEKLEVTSARPIEVGQSLVQTSLQRPGADKALRVDWRVRETDGTYKIIDIMVEGLSMAQTQRSEFSSVLRDNGGDMDKLMATLEDRLMKAREDRAVSMGKAASKS
jgi:phospholipid transport system substrate-binding protein